jgi:STE24 endopeptidase
LRAFPPARKVIGGLGLIGLAGGWALAALLLWQTSVPGDLRIPDLPADRYLDKSESSRATNYETFMRFDLLAASLAQLVALGLFAVRGRRYARESAAGRIGTGMLLGMLALAFAWLAGFPFGLAAHWWQRRYEVTELSYLDWALNDFLGAGGDFLFISAVLLVVMTLAGRWARSWWLVAVPILAALVMLFALVQPYLQPGLEPLHDDEIAADARRLARAQGISNPSIRVQDTQGLTSAPNAGALGVGPSERVIIWDNLLEDFERGEVRVVVAHELAHLSEGHVWKLIGWLALLGIPIAFVTARVTRHYGGLGAPPAVPLAVFVVAILIFASLPLQRAFSQRLEAEADWIALETTRDPDATVALFRGFVDRGLDAPQDPWWAQLLTEDHPGAMKRIEMAEGWRTHSARLENP